MTIKVSFRGEAELRRALSKMGAEAKRELKKVVDGTGLELRGDIVKAYNQGPATGTVYQKYKPRRTHRASSPGETPKTDTGRLASSVTFASDIARLSATVSSKLPYAAWLEYGTMKIAKRPAWVPAVTKITGKFNRKVEAAIRKSMP